MSLSCWHFSICSWLAKLDFSITLVGIDRNTRFPSQHHEGAIGAIEFTISYVWCNIRTNKIYLPVQLMAPLIPAHSFTRSEYAVARVYFDPTRWGFWIHYWLTGLFDHRNLIWLLLHGVHSRSLQRVKEHGPPLKTVHARNSDHWWKKRMVAVSLA